MILIAKNNEITSIFLSHRESENSKAHKKRERNNRKITLSSENADLTIKGAVLSIFCSVYYSFFFFSRTRRCTVYCSPVFKRNFLSLSSFNDFVKAEMKADAANV